MREAQPHHEYQPPRLIPDTRLSSRTASLAASQGHEAALAAHLRIVFQDHEQLLLLQFGALQIRNGVARVLSLGLRPHQRLSCTETAADEYSGFGRSLRSKRFNQRAVHRYSGGWDGASTPAFRHAEFSGSLAEKGTPHQRSNPIATQESRDPAPARVSVRRSRHVYRRMRCENDVQSRTLRLYRGG